MDKPIDVDEFVADKELPYKSTWKPLSNYLPTHSPRGQIIERREFKTCTSKIPDTKLLRY